VNRQSSFFLSFTRKTHAPSQNVSQFCRSLAPLSLPITPPPVNWSTLFSSSLISQTNPQFSPRISPFYRFTRDRFELPLNYVFVSFIITMDSLFPSLNHFPSLQDLPSFFLFPGTRLAFSTPIWNRITNLCLSPSILRWILHAFFFLFFFSLS